MASQASGRPSVRQALELAGTHYLNLIEFGILKIFINFKVFDLIPEEGDISIIELATKVGGEESLLERFSAYLVASEILASQTPGYIVHTTRSLACRTSEITTGLIPHVYHFFLRPMAYWSDYFEKNGLVEPKNASVIPLGLGTGHPILNLYGILDAELEPAKLFNSAQAHLAGIYFLKDVFNFSWMKDILASSKDGPAIVNIGGGSGLALRDILVDNKFIPPAQCAVFDLPNTIEGTETKAKLDEILRSVPLIGGTMLDTFPQPIKGALVYQFRRVLSEFVDNDIVLALKQTWEACRPDSRVLIIEELVKPGRSKFGIAQDISVMNFGGKRRSEATFRELAGKAGFRISALFEDVNSEFGVLELVLA